MVDIVEIYAGQLTDAKRLLAFGFVENGDSYVYSTTLMNGQFDMFVKVSLTWQVSTEVVDTETGENYALINVPDANGAFIGRVRTEYENILLAIRDKCYDKDVFKSDCAKQVISYIEDKYGDKIEFLWKSTPKNGIARRKDNAKWYLALLTVLKRRIGIDEDGDIEIIDLRMEPENIEKLLGSKKYLPGYHMNKKHWITICLDGSVDIEEIIKAIDISYSLALK